MNTRSLRHVVRSALLLPLVCAAAPATPAVSEQTSKQEAKVELELIPSGAMEKLGGYRPQQLKLSERKPAALKKAPEMSFPLFGEIKFGGKSYVVAAHQPKDGDAKLYADANGNGDLTDDPETTWTKDAYRGPDGAELTRYRGSIQLPLGGAGAGAGDKPRLVTLGAYRFDDNDPQRKQLKNTLLYYSDYAYEGDVTLAGKKYRAMLDDDNATG